MQDQTTSLQWLEQQLLGSADARNQAPPAASIVLDDIEV